MKKLRVFQNVKSKRCRSSSGSFMQKNRIRISVKNLGTVLLLLLLIPYIITFLFGNMSREASDAGVGEMIKEQLKEGSYTVINKTALGLERIPLEIYVADMLSRTMEEGYEMEALKAQAVLIRTNLMLQDDKEVIVNDGQYGSKNVPQECFRAVSETRGIYLEYEGNPIYGAYFLVSNGKTRSAKEVLKTDDYPYLSEVVCSRDFLSEEYLNEMEYSIEEFEKIWDKLKPEKEEEIQEFISENVIEDEKTEMTVIRDHAGYSLFLKYREKWIACEELRYELHLPSSDFEIRKEDETLVFTVKGTGHGLGMSQFAANEMAAEGSEFPEILEYFFSGTALTKAE